MLKSKKQLEEDQQNANRAKREARAHNKELIPQFLDRLRTNGYRFVILNSNSANIPIQIRIEDAIDIYPVNKKYYIVSTGERGVIADELYDFVYQYLVNAQPVYHS